MSLSASKPQPVHFNLLYSFSTSLIRLRLAGLENGLTLDRDVIGTVNIGLRRFSSDGSPVALGSTGLHEVWTKLVNPHRELTPLPELETPRSN